MFTQPETTSLPSFTPTGTGSPVTAEVSIRLSPLTTTPSSGILSPGRTSIMSPISISSGSSSITLSPSIYLTTSGRISTASIICLRLFPTAISSKSSPIS